MKLGELKKIIKDLPDESDIYFSIGDGCCGETLPLELKYYSPETFSYKGLNQLLFEFQNLPGYRTCIQSGDTRRKDEEYCKKYDLKSKQTVSLTPEQQKKRKKQIEKSDLAIKKLNNPKKYK